MRHQCALQLPFWYTSSVDRLVSSADQAWSHRLSLAVRAAVSDMSSFITRYATSDLDETSRYSQFYPIMMRLAPPNKRLRESARTKPVWPKTILWNSISVASATLFLSLSLSLSLKWPCPPVKDFDDLPRCCIAFHSLFPFPLSALILF
jgi:hypothetical protein